MHSSPKTIKKYLAIPESEIPEIKENLRERTHQQAIKNKQEAILEVRKLYEKGLSIEEISRTTGHTSRTIKKYLKEDCSANNGRYDERLPGKLASYEQEVIEMRSKGITYKKIHDLEAVKNGIRYKYNNGLAEGSVNKIKLTKRIMYGRSSFELLKAKLLLNEHYYRISYTK